MNFEILKRSHVKRNIAIIFVVIAIISSVVLNFTRAEYRVTQSIPLVNGTINYSLADLNIIAMYQENDNGEYGEIEVMPSSGYIINEEMSYCTLDGNRDENASLYTNDNGEHVISNLQKGSKCYLYFDFVSTASLLSALNQYNKSARVDFGNVYTDENTSTLFVTEDNDGKSYYFAGNPTDNWIKFGKWSNDTPDVYYGFSSADSYLYREYSSLSSCQSASEYNVNCTLNSRAGKDMYWRIVRINGDESIRIIYSGTSANTIGPDTEIGISYYNYNSSEVRYNAYVGYMYGDINANSYSLTHRNVNESNIKQKLDLWYEENLSNFSEMISYEAGFCNDRQPSTDSLTINNTGGEGTTSTYYGPYVRLYNKQNPTLKCENSLDLFTSTSSSKGNKMLIYPIGLITADEIVYAGGVHAVRVSNMYLNTKSRYWTMSPSSTAWSGGTYMFYMQDDSVMLPECLYALGRTSLISGVRPVINLKPDVTISSGDGTSSNPYVIF